MNEKLVRKQFEQLTEEINELKALQRVILDELHALRKSKKEVSAENEDWLDIKGVCKYLKICKNSVLKLIQNEVITPYRINERTLRFSKQELKENIKLNHY